MIVLPKRRPQERAVLILKVQTRAPNRSAIRVMLREVHSTPPTRKAEFQSVPKRRSVRRLHSSPSRLHRTRVIERFNRCLFVKCVQSAGESVGTINFNPALYIPSNPARKLNVEINYNIAREYNYSARFACFLLFTNFFLLQCGINLIIPNYSERLLRRVIRISFWLLDAVRYIEESSEDS